ncbi:unnamed protein product [Calicophoron daubneyi]|uniref:Antistasin-like domain-containing protein n=1 Tax=Calicophoron daubneyi TaxID=300641 RepID=A0AAV2THV4_CALDB
MNRSSVCSPLLIALYCLTLLENSSPYHGFWPPKDVSAEDQSQGQIPFPEVAGQFIPNAEPQMSGANQPENCHDLDRRLPHSPALCAPSPNYMEIAQSPAIFQQKLTPGSNCHFAPLFGHRKMRWLMNADLHGQRDGSAYAANNPSVVAPNFRDPSKVESTRPGGNVYSEQEASVNDVASLNVKRSQPHLKRLYSQTKLSEIERPVKTVQNGDLFINSRTNFEKHKPCLLTAPKVYTAEHSKSGEQTQEDGNQESDGQVSKEEVSGQTQDNTGERRSGEAIRISLPVPSMTVREQTDTRSAPNNLEKPSSARVEPSFRRSPVCQKAHLTDTNHIHTETHQDQLPVSFVAGTSSVNKKRADRQREKEDLCEDKGDSNKKTVVNLRLTVDDSGALNIQVETPMKRSKKNSSKQKRSTENDLKGDADSSDVKNDRCGSSEQKRLNYGNSYGEYMRSSKPNCVKAPRTSRPSILSPISYHQIIDDGHVEKNGHSQLFLGKPPLHSQDLKTDRSSLLTNPHPTADEEITILDSASIPITVNIDDPLMSGCPQLNCTNECPGDLRKLSLIDGCPTCECCPKLDCKLKCPKGYAADAAGCPICKCIK